MSLKPFANLRQIAFALRRNYRKRFVYIAYGLAPGARYKEFTIPKKSGGTRRICAPRIALLGLQRDILRLLESDYRPRAHVHGFVGGHQRSIVSNARQHVGKRWVLNIDLEDYFETIHFGRIRGRLMAPPYDYPEEIAQFIAHIACFQIEKEVGGSLRTTHVLMPGAALSPILANIVSDKLDAELARFCRQLGCTYTRYADDITISSNRRTFPAPIGRFANPDSHDDFILSDTFQQMIEDNGFRINHAKTRLLGVAFQQEVTGLVVNEKVNVKRKFVRDVRAMLHDWEFNGYAAASARHFNDKRPDRGRLPEQEATNFEWVLRGKIEFIRQVKGSTDQVFRGLAARFNALSSGGQFSIPLVEDSEVLNAAVWYLENDTDGGSVGTCFAVAENLFCDLRALPWTKSAHLSATKPDIRNGSGRSSPRRTQRPCAHSVKNSNARIQSSSHAANGLDSRSWRARHPLCGAGCGLSFQSGQHVSDDPRHRGDRFLAADL